MVKECFSISTFSQANSCNCFSCANPSNIKYKTSGFPDMTRCDSDDPELDHFYISDVDKVTGFNLYTYLEPLPAGGGGGGAQVLCSFVDLILLVERIFNRRKLLILGAQE